MKLYEEVVGANKEIDFINHITNGFKSHPMQLNKTMEADAEIINCKGYSADYLVVKTDGIHEEINQQLYEDPYLIGWMSVTVVVSDLAAVGSEPFGLLLSLQIQEAIPDIWLKEFQRGVNQACETYQAYIMGGDTNSGPNISVSATGIATIKFNKPMLRKPVASGDFIYSTGKFGLGNAYAYSKYFEQAFNVPYKPVARLQESRFIRNYATSCIDSSDGLFPALSVMCQLNQVGVKLIAPVQDILCDQSIKVYNNSSIPAWVFLAGPHGEYELMFTIPASDQEHFEQACIQSNWQPLLIGEVIPEQVINFESEDLSITSDTAEIANLYIESGGDINKYFEMLMQKQHAWQQHN